MRFWHKPPKSIVRGQIHALKGQIELLRLFVSICYWNQRHVEIVLSLDDVQILSRKLEYHVLGPSRAFGLSFLALCHHREVANEMLVLHTRCSSGLRQVDENPDD